MSFPTFKGTVISGSPVTVPLTRITGVVGAVVVVGGVIVGDVVVGGVVVGGVVVGGCVVGGGVVGPNCMPEKSILSS